MLQIRAAGKSFRGQTVFTGLDLAVGPGRFHVILGPSGCGKSTLFDGLTGVFPLDAGTLSWMSEPVPDLKAHAAYMQQKDLLLPWFCLLDNALLPARVLGKSREPARKKALGLFNRLGLNGYESHYPGQVSGGMRQRCALVRTLMFDRELILLDEPLSALDTITRRSLQSLLLLLQTGFEKTLLMITHDMDEALFLADEISVFTSRPMRLAGHYVLDSPKPRHDSDPARRAIKAQMMEKLQKDPAHEAD